MTTPAPSEIRAWARAAGHPVGDRGRLSPDLVAAYRAAQGPTVALPPGAVRTEHGWRVPAVG